MIKKSIVAMLAVAVLSLSTVNAFAAEAGVLGLKPSANQSGQSSTDTTANKEVQSDIQYDTGKYQYPAQQLIAEGRQFNRYNWRLYQRFADGQFDYKAWANNLGYVAVDYSDNNNSTENNVVTSNFNLKDWNNPYINGPLTWDDTGKKIFQTDNDIIFRKKVSDESIMQLIGLVPEVKIVVTFDPQGCWEYHEAIYAPMYYMNGYWHKHAYFNEKWWEEARDASFINKERAAWWNENIAHPKDPIQLYYPERPDLKLYISGFNMDRVAQHSHYIDNIYTDDNPNLIAERAKKLQEFYFNMTDFINTTI
jgi:hypothetical protein